MNVHERMSIGFLTNINSNVTGGASSTPSTSAFTPYQHPNSREQASAQSSHIFNPGMHIASAPLQERVTSQEGKENRPATAQKVASVPLPGPAIPSSSHPENYPLPICDHCKLNMKIVAEWEKNPTDERLTLLVLPFIINQKHDLITANDICRKALSANPHSFALVQAQVDIHFRLGNYLQMITNSKTLPLQNSHL